MQKFLTAILALVLMNIASASHANDSEAETSLGGLTLKQSEHISMDSEDLYISAKQVRVKYRFTNTSNNDVTTLVSFPLPTLPESDDGDWLYQGSPDFDTLKFETKINGKSAPLIRMTRAMIGTRDVTKRVEAAGWPVNWFNNYEFSGQFDKMTVKARQRFIDEGLIRRIENYDHQWIPAWKIARHITRSQVFPAGKTITVEHSYQPLIGGSVGGTLLKPVRKDFPEGIAHYRKQYCIDDYFLRGFDRRAAPKGDQGAMYGETWIGYILSSGANWKGPIKDFRLVIDKGSTKNLVSFCMDGVKKIAPTQFEVRKKNFTPTKDLNILIVEWHNIDA